MIDDLMTTQDAAEEMGCAERTVRRRAAKGQIQAEKLGDQWLIHRDAVDTDDNQDRETVPA